MAGPWINDFTRGALSPMFKSRHDLPIYRRGCQKLKNMAVLPQGGATKLPGNLYVAAAPGGGIVTTRLTGFIVSAAKPYILEWTDSLIRFYLNGAIVGAPYTVASPYAAADINDLKFGLSTSTVGQLYIFSSGYDPRRLAWTSDTSWALTTPTWTGQTFTGAGNRPHAACNFQRRLWVLKGSTLYASKIGNSVNFTVGPLDTDGIEIPLNGNVGSDPLWLVALKNEIVVGCTEGIIRISAGASGGAVTPGTVTRDDVSDVGASSVQGVPYLDRCIYVARDKRTLVEYNPNHESKANSTRNLSLLADHLIAQTSIKARIDELHVQQSPYRVIWCLTTGGQMCGLTYEPETDVLAWHEHENNSLHTYRSMAIVPPAKGSASIHSEDFVLYAMDTSAATNMVKNYYYRWWLGTTYYRVYLQQAVLQLAVGATTMNLAHLPNGTTVGVVKDGVTQADQVIASGVITLSGAGVWVAGLKYTATVAPMPIVSTTAGGRLRQRVVRAIARFLRTPSFQAGPDETNLESRTVTTSADPSTDDPDDVPLNSGFDEDANLYLVSSDGQPFTVLSIQPDVEVEEA